MTGRINETRDAIVAAIEAAMPELRDCSAQFGRFDLDELERSSIRAPAVRVGILGADIDGRADDNPTAMLKCAAFAIADGKDRDAAAWTMAEAIAVLLRRNTRFGLTHIGAPEHVRVGPVVSAAFKNRGIAVAAVEWTLRRHDLGDGIFDDEGIVWVELYVNDELVVDEPSEAPA